MTKNMTTVTTAWDASQYLDSPEMIAAYLDAAFEDGDPAVIATALGNIARARGMSDVAAAAGLGRASLYKSLSENGHPEFATILKVIKALGLRLTVAA